MFALVVGGGRIGSYLAQSLVADGHEVAVLEQREEIVAKLIGEVEARIIHGDGCEPEILEQAEIRRADLVVAVTGDDEDNLVISWLAKYTFGAKRVIARVNNPRNQWLFGPEWGVDVAVSAVHIIAKIIQEEATIGELITLLKLRKGEVALVELTAKPGSRAVGKMIRDLELPPDTVLVALLRAGEVLIPTAERVIEPGDETLALTPVVSEKTLAQLFGQA